jgi:predicted HD superfamily hydrolase involved in NAD metabolism
VNYEELLFKLHEEYKNFKKIDHLLGVEEMAGKLAELFYKEAVGKARLAGFLHDIARFFSPETLISVVRNSSCRLSREEFERPILLHGKASAVIAKKKFGIEDNEILNAIADHVTGRAKMPLLSKIVFVADAIEPSRKFDGVDNLRTIAFENLNEAFIEVLSNKIAWLARKKVYISGKTINLWNKIILKEETS